MQFAKVSVRLQCVYEGP